MDINKIIQLENDGITMEADDDYLYVRCKREMHKYDLSDMKLVVKNIIFKKDGKARQFAVGDDYIALTDFCDLYILNKDDLSVSGVLKIGVNQSSDLCEVRCAGNTAYLSIRNGVFATVDLYGQTVHKEKLCTGSTWDMTLAGDFLYAGTTTGELLEIQKDELNLFKKAQLCKPNIQGVVFHKGIIYAASRDKALRIIDADTFETILTINKVISTTTLLLGIWNDQLISADWNQVSRWDINTLQHIESFNYPTGYYIKGVYLCNGTLYGSDYEYIYQSKL